VSSYAYLHTCSLLMLCFSTAVQPARANECWIHDRTCMLSLSISIAEFTYALRDISGNKHLGSLSDATTNRRTVHKLSILHQRSPPSHAQCCRVARTLEAYSFTASWRIRRKVCSRKTVLTGQPRVRCSVFLLSLLFSVVCDNLWYISPGRSTLTHV
jgi:hypothetical protein